jgi:hypothetical protein
MSNMRIFELFEVHSQPRKNDCRYSEYRIYNNSLYIEAESNVDFILEEEDVSDKQYNELVEKELKNIIETLKTYGRYPVDGIPKYVAY